MSTANAAFVEEGIMLKVQLTLCSVTVTSIVRCVVRLGLCL